MAEVTPEVVDVDVDPTAERWMLNGVAAFIGGTVVGGLAVAAEALVDLPKPIEVVAIVATGTAYAYSAASAFGGLLLDFIRHPSKS